ncbi:MAG: NUDIX hydrolase [Gammaproteobacteria bacterium]|nr:MAG: NUDIX hydrolase [Gammaproteobacteria bacterium]
MAESKAAATPLPAATIVLLRDDLEEGLEIFMVVRHHQIDFASGALVFPGGKIDEQDADPALEAYCDGADSDPVMRAMQIGAIREAFEEAGVLLAREVESRQLVSGERLAILEHYRTSLHSGEVSLKAFLDAEQLRLACDTLVRFAHWVTPDMMPKRFDTHFFIARAPEDHVLLHDGHESVDSVWIRPQQVLTDAASGKRTVIFPTLRNVEKLADADTVEAAMTAAQSQRIVTVTPWTEKRDDGVWLRIPVEAGYRISEERMPSRSG